MEGRRDHNRRRILRCHETDRLEDELWGLAYDQISPAVLRPGKRSQPIRRPEAPVPESLPQSPLARSA
jgi:hypothetical protein